MERAARAVLVCGVVRRATMLLPAMLALAAIRVCADAATDAAAQAEEALVLTAPSSPNILYLMADDMRPQMGAYGFNFMHTPHLDRLASEGLLFTFAYTQYAICAPSRNSFLSGRR